MFTAMKFRQLTTVVATTALLLFSTAQAQVVTPATLTVDDNKIQAKLTLSSLIEVDLTVEFENSIGLNANNIDITAELLDPTDLTITDRLPSALTSAVSGFPVLVSISPKADAGFGFEGLAMVDLYQAFWIAGELKVETIKNDTATSAYTMQVNEISIFTEEDDRNYGETPVENQ